MGNLGDTGLGSSLSSFFFDNDPKSLGNKIKTRQMELDGTKA